MPEQTVRYLDRIAKEKAHFSNCTNLHELPAIFHYWSNKYILPKLQAVGYSGVTDIFEKTLLAHCARAGSPRFVSIGSGKGEMEIQLAVRLRSKNVRHFLMECVELNAELIADGTAAAEKAGVGENIRFIEADFNAWRATGEYDVVMASHSLHHVMNLEGLFDEIVRSLLPHGQFVTADMIGRNGHMRWPEALEIVQEFWKELPPPYRYNQLLKRHEEEYDNWDCSSEGFEGIRAQDILPLLVERFHFEMFVAHSNLVAPFTDRTFGHNFDSEGVWDRYFIDRVHMRDEQEMLAGYLKPTSMFAVMGRDPSIPLKCVEPFRPQDCIRWPNHAPARRTPLSGASHVELTETRNALEVARRQIEQAANSKWLRLGRALGLGPKLK